MTVTYFYYGLAFFTLGMTLLVRRAPEYFAAVRPSLIWLGIFALVHSFNEWLIMGELADALQILDGAWSIPIASGLSFLALMVSALLMLEARWPDLRTSRNWVLLIAGWLWFLAFILGQNGTVPAALGDFIARWLIGGPSALVIAFGFLQISRHRTRDQWVAALPEPFGQRDSAPFLLAAIALAVYGISTFLGPRLDFFPAAAFNAAAFESLFGFPIQIVRTLSAFALAFAVLAAIAPFQRLDRQHLQDRIKTTTRRLRDNERDLLENKTRLELAQSIAGVGILERDTDGGNQFWSSTLYEMLGQDEASFKPSDSRFFGLVHPDDRKLVRETFFSIEPVEDLSFRIRRNGEVRHLRASTALQSAGTGIQDRVTITLLDDTEIVQKEVQLRRSQRLEAVGQLAGGIAHDFNNLIQVIHGNAELMRVDPDPKYVDKITEAARRGSSLTGRLLAFARQQPLMSKSTDVGQLVEGMRDMLNRALGEQVELVIEVRDCWPVTIDPSQLESALLNLGLNARDALPDGGMITISAENVIVEEASKPDPEIDAGSYVRVSVSDDGLGMSEEIRRHVFEPFFTTKETGKGSGLGLSMVYGFVTQSRGHILIDSRPQRGTKVSLYLPRTEATPVADDRATLQVVNPARMVSARILVVEDNEDVREVPVTLLSREGYDVVSAYDAWSALETLQEQGPFDLVFSDVVLPGGMTGAGLAEAISQRYPDTRILLTSGYAALENLSLDDLPEKYDLLPKPWEAVELLDAVRQKLAHLADENDQAVSSGSGN